MRTLKNLLSTIEFDKTTCKNAGAELAVLAAGAKVMQPLKLLGITNDIHTLTSTADAIKHHHDITDIIDSIVALYMRDRHWEIVRPHIDALRKEVQKALEIVCMTVTQNKLTKTYKPSAGAGSSVFKPAQKEITDISHGDTIEVTNSNVTIDGDVNGRLVLHGKGKVIIGGKLGAYSEIIMDDDDNNCGFVVVRGKISTKSRISTQRQDILLCGDIAKDANIHSERGDITTLQTVDKKATLNTKGSIIRFDHSPAEYAEKKSDDYTLTLHLTEQEQDALIRSSKTTGPLKLNPVTTTVLAPRETGHPKVKDMAESFKKGESIFCSLSRQGSVLKDYERMKDHESITAIHQLLRQALEKIQQQYLSSYSVLNVADYASEEELRTTAKKNYKRLASTFNSDHLHGVTDETRTIFNEIFAAINEAKDRLLSGEDNRTEYLRAECDRFSLYRWIVDGSKTLREILGNDPSASAAAEGEESKHEPISEADLSQASEQWISRLFQLNSFAIKHDLSDTQLFGALTLEQINLGILRYQHSQIISVLEFLADRVKGLKESNPIEGRKDFALGLGQKLLEKFKSAYDRLVTAKKEQISKTLTTVDFSHYPSLLDAIRTEYDKGILYVTSESIAAQYTREHWQQLSGILCKQFALRPTDRPGEPKQRILGVPEAALDPSLCDGPYADIIGRLFMAPITTETLQLATLATQSMEHLSYHAKLERFCTMVGLHDAESTVILEPGKINTLQLQNFIESLYPGNEQIERLLTEPFRLFGHESWEAAASKQASISRMITDLQKVLCSTAFAKQIGSSFIYVNTIKAFCECSRQIIERLGISIPAPTPAVVESVAVPAMSTASAGAGAGAGAGASSTTDRLLTTRTSLFKLVWDTSLRTPFLDGLRGTINLAKLRGFCLDPEVADKKQLVVESLEAGETYHFDKDNHYIDIRCEVPAGTTVIVKGVASNLLLRQNVYGSVMSTGSGVLAFGDIVGKLITRKNIASDDIIASAILLGKIDPAAELDIAGSLFCYNPDQNVSLIGANTDASPDTAILYPVVKIDSITMSATQLAYSNCQSGCTRVSGGGTSIGSISAGRIGHIGGINITNSRVSGSVISSTSVGTVSPLLSFHDLYFVKTAASRVDLNQAAQDAVAGSCFTRNTFVGRTIFGSVAVGGGSANTTFTTDEGGYTDYADETGTYRIYH
ncbi:MAG: hypothetical protein P1U63_12785 [Coxiellaceae bacterium]|nr:hypothetical protein [Coxiellaceae bacterium]